MGAVEAICIAPSKAQEPANPQSTPHLAPISPGVSNVISPDLPRTSQLAAPSSAPSSIAGAYTLGAGDLVRVDIFDTPELTLEPRYTVLLDGSVNLPWVGSILIQGLTLSQASQIIAARYSRFIRNPIITVSLVAPRPLKIGVIGEVNRPGAYIITVIASETTQTSLNQRSTVESGSQWPTVSKAIQTAGGITQAANIRNIQIRRLQRPLENEVIDVDLWNFLKAGDLSQDILLRDGDTIVVPVATNLDAAEATQIASSNFSPEVIRVNVVGEVVTPGTVSVRPNTTLNQAILTAGGLRNTRARRNNVELIRLNPNGTVSRRTIALDFAQGLNDKNNPPLYNNDVIVVNRNTLANVTDFVGAVLSPVSGLFGLFTLLGIRFGNSD